MYNKQKKIIIIFKHIINYVMLCIIISNIHILFNRLIPLLSDVYLDMFVKALNNVCCPFTQLLEHINGVRECMQTDCLSVTLLAFENLFTNCFITEENKKIKGVEFETLEIYKDKLKVVLGWLKFIDLCFIIISKTIKKL